jgi:hypothetical protein
MRFHPSTRDAPPIRRRTLPHAPPTRMSPWFTWTAIAIVVLVAGIALAVATIPDGETGASLDDTSLAAQEDLFREVDAATVPGDLAWLDLDRQRAVFRTLESTGILTGVGLDAQRAMFRAADVAIRPGILEGLPGILEGMDLDAQRTLFRVLEASAIR